MTSAQNHLQLLNGNKISIVLICLALVWSSCFNKDTTNVITNNTGTNTTNTNSSTSNIEPKDTVRIPISDDLKNQANTWIDDTKPIKKDVYNIAMLLPFQSETAVIDTFTSKRPSEAKASQMAVDFYEGAMLAFTDLKRAGVNLNVKVLDTQNKDWKTQAILDSDSLSDCDVVIGPLYNKNLKLTGTYLANKKTHLVSPLSPSDITNGVPSKHIIQITPDLSVHAKNTIDYIYKNYPKDVNIVLVYKDEESEINNAQLYKDALNSKDSIRTLQEFKVGADITDSKYNAYSNYDLKSYIGFKQNTVFVVPSFHELFVNTILNEIQTLTEKNEISVFGMPYWTRYKSLRYDVFENVNLHISSSVHIDYRDDNVKAFKSRFRDNYKDFPTEYSFKGYDIVKTIGMNLYHTGTPFSEEPQECLHNTINIQPEYLGRGIEENEPVIMKYQNQSVHILQFKGYRFNKVN